MHYAERRAHITHPRHARVARRRRSCEHRRLYKGLRKRLRAAGTGAVLRRRVRAVFAVGAVVPEARAPADAPLRAPSRSDLRGGGPARKARGRGDACTRRRRRTSHEKRGGPADAPVRRGSVDGGGADRAFDPPFRSGRRVPVRGSATIPVVRARRGLRRARGSRVGEIPAVTSGRSVKTQKEELSLSRAAWACAKNRAG